MKPSPITQFFLTVLGGLLGSAVIANVAILWTLNASVSSLSARVDSLEKALTTRLAYHP